MSKLRQGMKVEITVPAGGLDRLIDGRFAGRVEPGTIGTFEGPHGKIDGYFVVRVETEHGLLYVPLAMSMFRPVPEGEK